MTRRFVLVAIGLLWGACDPLPCPRACAGDLSALVYGAGTSYGTSRAKESAATAGIYAAASAAPGHALELDLARTAIAARVDSANTEQIDLTVSWIRTLPGRRTRAGVHWIESSDPWSDAALTLFASELAGSAHRSHADLELAYTRYPHYSSGLGVLQISPGIGRAIYDATGGGGLHGSLRMHYIRLLDPVIDGAHGDLDRNMISVEADLAFLRPPWSLRCTVWSGRQSFAVRRSGFLVFNLSELHSGGYGATLRRRLGAGFTASVGAFREQFRELGFDDPLASTTFSATLGILP